MNASRGRVKLGGGLYRNVGGACSSVTDGAAKDVDHCVSPRFIT
jgi:hypothetical protein